MQALVIDDEPQVRSFVSMVLRDDNWTVSEADSAETAFEMLTGQDWALVLCDVVLGGADGFSVLRRVKEESPDTQVVLMTGHGTAVGAFDATAFGAYDYLLKPFGVDELHSLTESVRTRFVHKTRHRFMAATKVLNYYNSDIELIGRSQAFIEVMKQVGRVAATNLPVLLTGESGTGKEVVASALHRRSKRASMPFVAVNCGAIPGELIESELFGHVRGSFTGADRDRRGLFEEADGGTVLLDEITETTPAFQVKLLRALQEGEIRKVGSNRTQKIDVRVIAASNRDVETEVNQGRFRQDLFYRLNAVTIFLPPLRERREDILPLAASFSERIRGKGSPVAFSPEALFLVEQYPWPGNIRELENAIVRAVALCGNEVRPEDLPERIRNFSRIAVVQTGEDGQTDKPAEDWPPLAEIEGRYVARVLAHTGGNKQAAARLLGIDRKTLERMIKRHSIPPVISGRASRVA